MASLGDLIGGNAGAAGAGGRAGGEDDTVTGGSTGGEDATGREAAAADTDNGAERIAAGGRGCVISACFGLAGTSPTE